MDEESKFPDKETRDPTRHDEEVGNSNENHI
jgi:hypothetical protein